MPDTSSQPEITKLSKGDRSLTPTPRAIRQGPPSLRTLPNNQKGSKKDKKALVTRQNALLQWYLEKVRCTATHGILSVIGPHCRPLNKILPRKSWKKSWAQTQRQHTGFALIPFGMSQSPISPISYPLASSHQTDHSGPAPRCETLTWPGCRPSALNPHRSKRLRVSAVSGRHADQKTHFREACHSGTSALRICRTTYLAPSVDPGGQ
ncbi:hypothetical protein N658DRAFT_291890 [Parathielavia hyrcaniae]|uniref:Uncharacterized protein n=1 Tax=Parathielavia hyrcaniae TaxID=113614 RepID=A0AAN6PUM9_9PEZI|nr:hypothetical protein N658DRAFT_291890 [Parathielavia hyrcaniae]